MNLSRARQGALKQLVVFLERGLVTQGDGEEMFALLHRLMGTEIGALTQGAGFEGWVVADRLLPDWLKVYERYGHQDPAAGLLGGAPLGTWYLVNRDSDAPTKHSDLYDGFSACGLADSAITRVDSPFTDDLYMVLYRGRGRRSFTEDDRFLLRLIYPHLAGALAARRVLAALAAPASLTGLDPDERLQGSLTIGYPARTIGWTVAARRLFQDRLGAISPSGWARIERMLLAAAARFGSAQIGGRSQVLLPGLRVEFANVPPQASERRRLAALLMRETAATATSSPAAALLSPRQLAVARRAAAGTLITEIADELGITRETVRTHLKAVYTKLGVSRRAELARLVT